MDVIEITRQLGTALQQNEAYIEYNLCKQKNDEDKELQELIGQFNLLRISLNEEFSKEANKNDEKVKEINAKLRDCYNEVMANENMKKFNEAKMKLDTIVKKINDLIGLFLEGEDPATAEPAEGCSGSCSSCGGCH